MCRMRQLPYFSQAPLGIWSIINLIRATKESRYSQKYAEDQKSNTETERLKAVAKSEWDWKIETSVWGESTTAAQFLQFCSRLLSKRHITPKLWLHPAAGSQPEIQHSVCLCKMILWYGPNQPASMRSPTLINLSNSCARNTVVLCHTDTFLL